MSDPITAKDKGMKTNRGMKMNNPSEQRAYVRRLKKLRAQVRRWGGDYRKESRRQVDGPFLIGDPRERRWGDYRHPHGRDRLQPVAGRKNREIDDGGLD